MYSFLDFIVNVYHLTVVGQCSIIHNRKHGDGSIAKKKAEKRQEQRDRAAARSKANFPVVPTPSSVSESVASVPTSAPVPGSAYDQVAPVPTPSSAYDQVAPLPTPSSAYDRIAAAPASSSDFAAPTAKPPPEAPPQLLVVKASAPAPKPMPASAPKPPAPKPSAPKPSAPALDLSPEALEGLKRIKHIVCVELTSHDRNWCCWEEGSYDVRQLFKDPPTWHDGRHKSVQDKLLQNHTENWEWLCCRVREDMEACRDRVCRIGLFCNGGKHRSVAAIELLACVFRTMGKEVRIRHRSLEWHAGRACDCMDCNMYGNAGHPRKSPAMVELFCVAEE